MIMDLGQFGGLLEATASFSSAVVVAMLPYVNDVAGKLELPLPQPITLQQIEQGGPNSVLESRNGEMAGCAFRLKGGWVFGFQQGHLSTFESPHAFSTLQNPDEIREFVGAVRMSKDEAVELARNTLTKLGIPLEAVFAEQEPHVRMPSKTRTGIVPHYLVRWLSPRSSADPKSWTESVQIEVNADAKRVEYIRIAPNSNLRRAWPEFAAEPVLRPKRLSANPEYAWKLLPIALKAVEDYAGKLSLPVPKPLTTDHVARFSVSDNGGWPHSELELTNGWRFVYRNSQVNGYYAPDALFDFDRRPFTIKEISGKSKLNEAEATKLIRQALSRLNYPTKLVLMDFKPKVTKSAVPNVPRYQFAWYSENEEMNDLVSKVEAEVDMENGKLKSLYFDNVALWNKPPPIDVPIAPPRVDADTQRRSAPMRQPTELHPPRPRRPLKSPQ